MTTGARIGQAVAAIALSMVVATTAGWLFHGTFRSDFAITAGVAGFVVNGIIDAVTTRMRDHQLALERSLLEHAADLQAARVAGQLAHEVKNPLGAVIGNLELAQEILAEDPASPELSEVLTVALQAARHMTAVLADLRPVVDAAEPQGRVDVGDAIAAVARIAAPQVVAKGAQIAVEPVPKDLAVVFRRHELVQVLLNLVLNAAQATRPGVPNPVRIAATAEGDRVHIVVADAGTGMPEAVLARAREPGFTTRGGQGGTGLGLAIVDRLIRRAGGALTLRSAEGRGTEVHLAVPRAADAELHRLSPLDGSGLLS